MNENEGFWCQSYQKNITSNLRFRPKKNLYSFFHLTDNLIGSLKQSFETQFIEYVSNTKVEIIVYNLTTSVDHDCDAGSYDECVSQQRMQQKTNCSLPFELGQQLEGPICQTYEEGIKVVREILTSRKKCNFSCLQIDVKYKEEPEHYLHALANKALVRHFVKTSGDKSGYLYQIPKKVKLLSNVYEYTFPVALGYFGSIVGIFTGVSIFSILVIIVDALNIKKGMKTWILKTVQIGIFIYLLVIFIMLLMKYIQKPVANSIIFAKSKSDFSLSVCSLPFTYASKISTVQSEIEEEVGSIKSKFYYQLNDTAFWEQWRNISTMIDTITLDNGTNKVDLISADYENTRYLTVLPYNNVSVAICHTFDLSQHNTILNIHLVYNAEIEMYVHKQGQFLYEWSRKENKILPSSKENVRRIKGGVRISDTAFFLNTETITSLQLPSKPETYDDCLKDEGEKLFGTELIQCYLGGNFSNKCLELDVSLENITSIINNQSTCYSPETVMSIKTSQSNYLLHSVIELSYGLIDSTYKGLGLTTKEASVSLIFPSFTRISKVRFVK